MTAPSSSQGPGAGASSVLRLLFERRRLVVRAVTAVVALTVAAALILPRTWTARGSFVAQAGSVENLGALAGLASQFGVNIGSGAGGYPPRFYAALVTSDEVLGVVVDEQAPGASEGSPITVAEALGVKGETPAIRRARAIELVRREVVGALYDQRTGLTSFSVQTGDPQLSARIAGRIVDELNRFNGERRRSRASTERRFVEQRQAAVAAELRDVEDSIQRFLARNRAYESSPERKLEFERLTRRQGQLTTVLTSLTQSFEQARIEEVRDTPVLTVIEAPVVPVLPDRRPMLQWAIGAGLLATLVLLGGLIGLHLVGLLRVASTTGPDTVGALFVALAGELRRPWRLLW